MSRTISPLTSYSLPCFSVLMLALVLPRPVHAQEDAKPDEKPAAAAEPATADDADKTDTQDADDSESDEAKPADPFAVPENATAKELFQFIDQVKRNRGRTLESAKKAARAATDAATVIRELEGIAVEEEIKAIREQMSALSFLSRFDPETRRELDAVVEGLKNDTRDQIARFGALEELKASIQAANNASQQRQEELIANLKQLLEGHDFDREAYSLASSLGRSIERSNTALAASFYEEIGAMMKESSDEQVSSRADKMIGAARRMRLPGNFMEVMGTTADGKEFVWDQYRGKVVLVDFWASWCGPCRAEVPNMKRNLDRYGEKGFEIVGVNLDRNMAALSSYVEKEGIPWVSLFSDKEGERGWDNPLAAYYGISAIPTAVLVDQEGKVVSMSARGKTLDKLLADLLGEPDEPDEKMAKIDPQADQILQQASDYLARLERFDVNATLSVKIEADGMDVNLNNRQQIRVWRPNRLAIQSDQGDFGGDVTTISDGNSLYRYSHDKNEYSVVEAPDSLAKIAAGNQAVIGLELLGSVLMQENLRDVLLKSATELTYVESETLESDETHHLKIARKRGGIDIWIQSGNEPIIRRIVPNVSDKRLFGVASSSDTQVDVRLDLSEWKVNPELQEDDFAFSIPEGAKETDSLFAELNPSVAPLHRLVGQTAPAFELPLFGGGSVDLASHRDNEVVILDFWASWCGPCRRAMPEIIEVASEFKNQGVVLYTVNLAEDEETIAEFLKETEFEITVPMDREGDIGKMYGVRAIPQTVLIGKDGRVQVVHIGSSANLADQLRAELTALVAGEDLGTEAAKEQTTRMLADLVTPPGTWSPPGNPDPQAILSEARADASAGRYELALEKHVWFHENVLQHQPSMVGVRLSFALSYWMRLAREYPPAMEKLSEVRDRALREAKSGNDVRRNFNDFLSINRYLGDTQLTADAFKSLEQQESDVAKSLFALARPALIKAGEYELSAKYINPENIVKQLRLSLKRFVDGTEDERQQEMLDRMADYTKKRVINDAATTAALLIIADRDDDAEQFVSQIEDEWAKTKWENTELQTALKSALQGKVPDPWP